MEFQQLDVAPGAGAQISRRDSHSFVDHELALEGWDQTYRQLSAGRFSGRVETLGLGAMTLQREQVGCCVENQFSPPGDSVVIGFNLPGSVIYDAQLGPVADWQPLVVTSAREHRIFARGCFDVLMVSFPQEALPEGLHRPARLAADPQGNTAKWLLALMGSVKSGHASDSLLQMAPDLAADALSAWGDPAAAPGLSERRSMAAFDDILGAMGEVEPEAMTATRLSQKLGRPRAELRSACKTVTGLDLSQFLLARRLSDVHRALLRGQGAGVKVSDVAMDHGFLHWGRFAQAYRAMFAERPSETLQRRGPAVRGALPHFA
ncbi:AraC family transcriptional regulator [Poseidonocella sp. HB161398]|uniref:AraC family transcriptional regulator n=1 Tax=Poseidonocella sp. HB161398 TaxID=2320855 RepID=UPI0011086405|nr:AraC family transcriptional regulator [Poseidonocella sp. HB161398]